MGLTVGEEPVKENEKILAKNIFSNLKNQWKNPYILQTRGWCIPDMKRTRTKDKELLYNLYHKKEKKSSQKNQSKEKVKAKQFVKNMISRTINDSKKYKILRKTWSSAIDKFIEE